MGSKNRVPISPIERSIRQRESGIKRMKDEKRRIANAAGEQCAAIEKRIARSLVILEAIRRGELLP